MRLLYVVLAVGLVAASTILHTRKSPRKLTFSHGKLGIKSGQIPHLLSAGKHGHIGSKAHDMFDRLLKDMESSLHKLTARLKPIFGTALGSVTAISTDFNHLAVNLKELRSGKVKRIQGLQTMLLDIMKILHTFGLKPSLSVSLKDIKSSVVNLILNELKKIMTSTLPDFASVLRLSEEQSRDVVVNFANFVTDVEDMEEGRLQVDDGVINVCTDIIKVLQACEVDTETPHEATVKHTQEKVVTGTERSDNHQIKVEKHRREQGQASSETDTPLTPLVKDMESALYQLTARLKPILGLAKNSTTAISTNFSRLVVNLKELRNGQSKPNQGLQTMLLNIMRILRSFGLKPSLSVTSEDIKKTSVVDIILDELRRIVDRTLPDFAAVLGLSEEQSRDVVVNFDNFVTDVEGMERGTIQASDGVVRVCTDILEVLKACGINAQIPPQKEPSVLDRTLYWLDLAMDSVLDLAGPFIGLGYDGTKQVEADVHQLIGSVKTMGDGRVDVDTGLEAILNSTLALLGDFGLATDQQLALDAVNQTRNAVDNLIAQLEVTLMPVLVKWQQQLDSKDEVEEVGEALQANEIELVDEAEAEEAVTTTVAVTEDAIFNYTESSVEEISADMSKITDDILLAGLDRFFKAGRDPEAIDKILEQIRTAVQKFLPLLGPQLGLTKEQIKMVISDMNKLVVDLEDVNHQKVDAMTGLENIIHDVLDLLDALGLNAKAHLGMAPTVLNDMLAKLKMMLMFLLEKYGTQLGFSDNQINTIESDVERINEDVAVMQRSHDVNFTFSAAKVFTDVYSMIDHIVSTRNLSLPGQPLKVLQSLIGRIFFMDFTES